jgi:[methyl-Co(III) methanol-specific corrinoid protein]:coenzyme M methyltransferase
MNPMNFRERLFKAVNNEPTDRPPLICPGGMMTMAVREAMEQLNCPWPAAHSDASLMARLTAGMVELGGIENLGVPFCMTIEAEELGAQVNLGNLTREPHVVSYAMEHIEELDRLSHFDPSSGRAGVCCDAIRKLKQDHPDLPVVANVTGPVSLATSLMDPLLYYRALRRDKENVHRLNDICVESAIHFGDAMVAVGADLICIADPSATGDLLGPQTFAEFCLPYLNRITDHFQNTRNTSVIVHICGDIKATGKLLPRLTAKVISVDSVVAIKHLKQLAPDKVSMGNVSTFILEKADPEKVAKAAGVCLNHGVDILAPACGISPITPLANIRSLADCVAAWGQAAGAK